MCIVCGRGIVVGDSATEYNVDDFALLLCKKGRGDLNDQIEITQ